MKKETVEFIPVSSLVPEGWEHWFYGIISEDAPFSWGDNNRTLITALRFHDHCADRLDEDIVEDGVNMVDIDNFLRQLEELGQTYIDLEN